MNKSVKKLTSTMAVLGIAVTGLGLGLATPANATPIRNKCTNTNILQPVMKTKYMNVKMSGIYYSCWMRVTPTGTGKLKLSHDISNGASVSSARKGFAYWSFSDNKGKVICNGYIKPNNKMASTFCPIKKGVTYTYSVGKLSKLQKNSLYMNIN